MKIQNIRVGIVGVSGYTGRELCDLVLRHSQVRLTYVAASKTVGRLDTIWPEFKGRTNLICESYDAKQAVESCDLIFLALPHTQSVEVVPYLLQKGIRVIDLSADYRLNKMALYKKWYGIDHSSPKLLRKSVYGFPELNRVKIKKAQLIANPGCYPTAALLSLMPVVATYTKEINHIVVDAKSGVSGAGRKAAVSLLAAEVCDNFKAYKVLAHQHTPEIELYLSRVADQKVNVHFVAHLLPFFRGIQETIYVHLNEKMSLKKMHTIYKKFYKTEPFVRVLDLGTQPEVKHVTNTNFCDIALTLSDDRKLLVITSVIDNLVKGAAGQAVHNMNIMCGFSETEALI